MRRKDGTVAAALLAIAVIAVLSRGRESGPARGLPATHAAVTDSTKAPETRPGQAPEAGPASDPKTAGAAKERPAETRAEVPALEAFHEVIYEMWHEAWPKEDTEHLARLLPRIRAHRHELANARLPGILRDKRIAWEEGVVDLVKAASEYEDAVEKKDDRRLLAAAETLHATFEALVRLIRPVLPEMDEFHAVLYVLYHKALPAYDYAAMRAAIPDLVARMAVLNHAVLPKRFAEKEKAFTEDRLALSKAVDALVKTAAAGNDGIPDAVVEVHGRYRALEQVFE